MAALAPFVTNDAGAHGWREAGTATLRYVVAALVFGLVAAAVTWHRSPAARAVGRVVVAVLLCGVAGISVVEGWKNDAARLVLDEALRVRALAQDSVRELQDEERATVLDDALAPARLASADGRQAIRARLVAMQKQRIGRRELAKVLAQSLALPARIPAGPVHDAAYRLVAAGGGFVAQFAELDDAQGALLTAVDALCDDVQWRVESGALSVVDGRFVASAPGGLDGVDARLAAVGAAAAHVRQAADDLRALAARTRAQDAANRALLRAELDY